jgi:hypothetical protein
MIIKRRRITFNRELQRPGLSRLLIFFRNRSGNFFQTSRVENRRDRISRGAPNEVKHFANSLVRSSHLIFNIPHFVLIVRSPRAGVSFSPTFYSTFARISDTEDLEFP